MTLLIELKILLLLNGYLVDSLPIQLFYIFFVKSLLIGVYSVVILVTILCKVINNSKDDKVSIKSSIIITFITLVVIVLVFNRSTLFNSFSYKYYPYITGSLFIFYILIVIGIYFKKREKNN